MRILKITEYSIEFDNGKDISFDHYQECCEINYADFEQAETEAAQIVAETAIESTNDDETTKHTANEENASEWTIDETDMTYIQWLCKWLSERRPEYKAVFKWMYEREEERKTRDAIMIVGGRGGGEEGEDGKITREERNRDT